MWCGWCRFRIIFGSLSNPVKPLLPFRDAIRALFGSPNPFGSLSTPRPKPDPVSRNRCTDAPPPQATSGWVIVPLSPDQALEWLETHGADADTIAEHFPVVEA